MISPWVESSWHVCILLDSKILLSIILLILRSKELSKDLCSYIYTFIIFIFLDEYFDITSESSYLCLLHSNFYKSIMHGFMADFFVCYISIQTPHFDVIYPPFSGNKRVRIQSKLHVTAIMSHEPWFMNIFSYEYYKIRSRKHVIVISFHSKYYILILGVVHVVLIMLFN